MKSSRFYDEKEGMPPEEREKYYREKLRWVVACAYENSPAVRTKMERARVAPDDIRTIEDLEKIPVTSQEELLKLERESPPDGGFLAVPVQNLLWVTASPGPLCDPIGTMEDRALAAKAFYAAGFRKGDLVLNSFAYHLSPGGPYFHDGLRHLGCTLIPAGVGNTDLQVQIMHDYRVTGYAGTPSFLLTLIKRAEEAGYNFRKDFALRNTTFTGEMYPPSLRKTLEQDYGIDTYQLYSKGDVGFMAYECREKSGMHIAEEVIVEIVDPETGKQLGPGEVGEVVVTCFNSSHPFVRLGEGDLSSYTDETCPCGRTSRRLIGIVGRVAGAVKVRGMFIQPYVLEQALSAFPQILKHQLVVARRGQRDEATLKLEVKPEELDEQSFSRAVTETVREKCKVRPDKIEFLPQGTIPKDARAIADERTYEE